MYELLEKYPSIGVHNMNGEFNVKYNLFVSAKRYDKYWQKVQGMPILVPKIQPRHAKYVPIRYDNIYPSSIGAMVVDDWQNGMLMFKGSGMNGGMAALGFAVAKGAENVYYIGMDGYSNGAHHFYKEKDNNWKRLMEHEKATKMILDEWSTKVNIKILTPTVYDRYYEKDLIDQL